MKYNNFSNNLYNNSFISVFLVKYSNFSCNYFSFHFIFFSLFIVTFFLRFWKIVKGTKELNFCLIGSLIFNAVLVWKHFNFLTRSCTILIVTMYVEMKFQKITKKFYGFSFVLPTSCFNNSKIVFFIFSKIIF